MFLLTTLKGDSLYLFIEVIIESIEFLAFQKLLYQRMEWKRDKATGVYIFKGLMKRYLQTSVLNF